MRAVNNEPLRVPLSHQLGVLLRICGIPAPLSAVGNPDPRRVAPVKAYDQIDVGIDLPELTEAGRGVEDKLDGTVAAEVDRRVGVTAIPQER